LLNPANPSDAIRHAFSKMLETAYKQTTYLSPSASMDEVVGHFGDRQSAGFPQAQDSRRIWFLEERMVELLGQRELWGRLKGYANRFVEVGNLLRSKSGLLVFLSVTYDLAIGLHH
jgi:hypothetical protein